MQNRPPKAPPHSSAVRRARGIFRSAAPRGLVRIQAVDSTGTEFLHLEMPDDACDDEVIEFVRAKLDQYDPIGRIYLLSDGD